MLKTKSGVEIVIIKGGKKCVEGIKPFVVRYATNQFPTRKTSEFDSSMGTPIYPEKYSAHWNKPFKLRKKELIYDSEEDLLA